MREILRLTKICLLNNYGLQGINFKKLDKESLKKMMLPVLIIVMIATVYGKYYDFVAGVSETFAQMQQSDFFIALTYFGISFTILLFCIPAVMSYFYYSKDVEYFLPLPIKPKYILIAKFNVIYLYEFIFSTLLLFPMIMTNGSNINASLSYYIIGFIEMIFVPIIPLVIGSLLVIVTSRFVNYGKNKNLLKLISLFVMTILILAVQIFVQKLINKMMSDPDFIVNLLNDNKSLVNVLGKVNIFAKWMSNSLVANIEPISIVYFILFLVANLLAYYLLIIVAQKLFIGGIIGGNEVAPSKTKVSIEEIEKSSSIKHSVFYALLKNDVINIIKTPIFVFNCYAGAIMLPILIVVLTLANMESSFSALIGTIEAMPSIYMGFVTAGIIAAIGLLVSPVSSTSFSREGKYFWISRTIPVSPRDQILARIVSHMIPVGLMIVMISVCIIFIFGFSTDIVLGIVLGVIANILWGNIGLIIDIKKPLLNWTNPQRAVKQNMNVLYTMAINFTITFVLGYSLVLLIGAGVDKYFLHAGFSLGIIIMIVVTYKMLYNRIERRFMEIE